MVVRDGGVSCRLSANEHSEIYLKSVNSLYFGISDNYILLTFIKTNINKDNFIICKLY